VSAPYAEKLAAMTDVELVKEGESQIWLSAFASNNPRAPAHAKADAIYDEAVSREKPWLYQEAWNRTYLLCGYEPSAEEIARARAPSSQGEQV
jgi:hypothetical protein